MADLTYQSRPELRRPVLVAAFEGWADAGEASSGAIDFLRDVWDAEPFATLDPEGFFDFQAHRPHVRLNEDGAREIDWPTVDFSAAKVPSSDHDVVLLRGIEPSMRWRSFSDAVLQVASDVDVELVILLGALFAGRPHTRPTRVTGTASTPELSERFTFAPPRYEGPTGVVGVLMDAFRRAGTDAVTLWAWVPHYVQGSASPQATLALVRRLRALIGFEADLRSLETSAAGYQEMVNDAVRADPEIKATVEELERRADDEDADNIPSGDEIAAEVERYLRGRSED